MDIAAWLRGLGLERYEQAFRENEIDLRVLPELTADDLKELGVTAIGHRRLLLKAIANLAGDGGHESADDAPAAPPSLAATEAERRQLTLMFCDLVGSTALSARLDPEDLREVIGAYHAAVAAEAGRFGGYVAKYMGDGVLLYFGYPEAHEDDAERAVRTGLAMAERVAGLETQPRLAARIGIATGLVVVGDLIGTGDAQERGVIGETPNLAARLQDVAPSGAVVIAEGTRRLLGDLFELRDLGTVVVKGLPAPVAAWQVVRPSAVESRFEALRASALTPLVGREEELALILRRWRRAKAGDGQVVLIGGEAGIGKSRLSAALRERLEGEDHIRVRYFTSPHHQDSAFYPFISQLERAARFERDDSVEMKLDRLEALLAPAAPSAEEVALLGELLSLPAAARYPLPPSTPQRKKEKTYAALLRQLDALARRRPVLMVFEDLHWIDPSSRELLDRTIERVASLPVLLIATFRPEFTPPWSGLPQVTAMTLARLDRRTGAAMVAGVAGAEALADELAAEIVERADGVPLFVEELTRAVLEAGGGSEGVETTLAGALSPTAAVPAALHAPLMARLDRLGRVPKEIAQIAAAIGREFSYELLAPVAERREAELLDALGRLGEAGLVFSRGAPPHANYLFKHTLVRDAAYYSLLRRRREELHARIAAALEADFANTVAAEPELLARHLTEAGLFEKAVPYWQRAGERATERSAYLESIAHLKRGIETLARLPESRERDEQELHLQAALIAPASAIAAGLGRAATRVVELGRRISPESPAQLQAVWAGNWLAHVHMVRGELRAGLALEQENLSFAKRLCDPYTLAGCHYVMGQFHYHLGDLVAARQHFEESLALYDPERDRAKAARFGFDICMACHSWLAHALWTQGFPDRALCHAEAAIAAARAASHLHSEAWALCRATEVHRLRGDAALCHDLAEATLALATEQVLPFFVALAAIYSGAALVEDGRLEEGLAQLRLGLDAHRVTGTKAFEPLCLALLAEACLATGRIEEGRSAVRQALAVSGSTEARFYEAELNRIEGELLLTSEEPYERGAEAAFRNAIEIARAQQAKSWELRAVTSLARLLARQGKHSDARELLAPIYGWFTEGFDTGNLKEAKALLGELA